VAAAEAGHKDKLICYDCGVACDMGALKEERLFYLRRMNAWTKPVEAIPLARPGDRASATVATAGDGVAAPAPAHLLKRAGRRAPPTRIEQGEPHRIRLRYTKLGRVAFLGHLDLVRHLPRIFRRAGVELRYSIGFHPKPDLSFGPALGLGIPSLGELLDVKLAEPVPAAELVRRLQRVTLDGIDWLAGVALGANDRALGRVVARAGFWAKLPAGATVERGIAVWRGGAPILVKRRGEGNGVGRMIDIRRAVATFDWLDARAEHSDACRRLGWERGDDAGPDLVQFQLAVSAAGSAKPVEVMEGLFGPAVAADVALARVGLWAVEGDGEETPADALPADPLAVVLIDPLDIDRLRSRPTPLATTPGAAAAGARLSAVGRSPERAARRDAQSRALETPPWCGRLNRRPRDHARRPALSRDRRDAPRF
jgi:radical SAM-linked protein